MFPELTQEQNEIIQRAIDAGFVPITPTTPAEAYQIARRTVNGATMFLRNKDTIQRAIDAGYDPTEDSGNVMNQWNGAIHFLHNKDIIQRAIDAGFVTPEDSECNILRGAMKFLNIGQDLYADPTDNEGDD